MRWEPAWNSQASRGGCSCGKSLALYLFLSSEVEYVPFNKVLLISSFLPPHDMFEIFRSLNPSLEACRKLV